MELAPFHPIQFQATTPSMTAIFVHDGHVCRRRKDSKTCPSQPGVAFEPRTTARRSTRLGVGYATLCFDGSLKRPSLQSLHVRLESSLGEVTPKSQGGKGYLPEYEHCIACNHAVRDPTGPCSRPSLALSVRSVEPTGSAAHRASLKARCPLDAGRPAQLEGDRQLLPPSS